MAFEVHALMEDANNDNAALVPPEEQDMAAGGIFEISAPNMVARPPSARVSRSHLDRTMQKSDVTVGLPVFQRSAE
jgi:hypothetical protein